MEHDIVSKLRTHLQSPVDTECKVVYLLCQLRKLGAGQKLPFSLQMCFNWALHVDLDCNSGANAFLAEFDDYVGGYNATKNANSFLTPFHGDLLFILSFRSDLKAFLELKKLPTDLCDDANWKDFIHAFSGVIEDGCMKPWSTKKKPFYLKNIEQVIFSKEPITDPHISANSELPFFLSWTVHQKPELAQPVLTISVSRQNGMPALNVKAIAEE